MRDDYFSGIFGAGWTDPKAKLLLDIVTKAPEVKLRELRDIADAMGFTASIHLAAKPQEGE